MEKLNTIQNLENPKEMEKLDTIQKRENLNEVYRIGDKGPGGGYHEYMIVTADCGQHMLAYIQFQKGARYTKPSTAGVLDCDLLEVVRDRLKAFCVGTMPCKDTELALSYVEAALHHLNRRVEDRIERQVLGTMEK